MHSAKKLKSVTSTRLHFELMERETDEFYYNGVESLIFSYEEFVMVIFKQIGIKSTLGKDSEKSHKIFYFSSFPFTVFHIFPFMFKCEIWIT